MYLPVIFVVDSLVRTHTLHQKFSLKCHIAGDAERLGHIELRAPLGSERILDSIADQGGIELLQDVRQGQVFPPCRLSPCRGNTIPSNSHRDTRLTVSSNLHLGNQGARLIRCE